MACYLKIYIYIFNLHCTATVYQLWNLGDKEVQFASGPRSTLALGFKEKKRLIAAILKARDASIALFSIFNISNTISEVWILMLFSVHLRDLSVCDRAGRYNDIISIS